MALTRKMLKAMGIDDDKIEMIIEAHAETTDALKKERDEARQEAEKNNAKPTPVKDTEEYKALKQEFDNYKSDVSAKESKAAKESAVRAYFESKNIKGKNLDIAMRGSRDEIAAIEMADGKIKDASALDALIAGDFAGLVVKSETRGAGTEHPAGNSGSGTGKTKAEIMAIKDTAARQKAIAENPELFGIK